MRSIMTKWLGVLASLGCLLGNVPAGAQTYPTKTITMVVTAAPGGVSDIVARALGKHLSDTWGQQVLIENKGGGAHITGAALVANAAPDGHTLMLTEAGTFVINPTLYPKEKMPFDVEKGFIPITGLIRIHHALITMPNFVPNRVSELIALARQKPGEMTYGTAGLGSAPHVNMARFENAAGVKLNAIHYRGATPAMNDVMGGHANMMLVSVSSALPSLRSGKVKMLGIGSAQRLPEVPDVPTIAESGALPGYIAGTWFGLATTGGTPREIVMKINAEVLRLMNDPAFRERFLKPQLYEAMASSPEQFVDMIRAETQVWAKVIREQNLAIGN
jgi:tripartite-type tricarboxylate transporter receptor subunit TctC